MTLGCMLAQLDDLGKERSIYDLSKRMLEYECRYIMIESFYLALLWATKRLRHYMTKYSIRLVSQLDPMRYLFDKPVLIGRLMRWLVLLTEFDIQYVTQKSMKEWRLYFDGTTNQSGFGIDILLISPQDDHIPRSGWKPVFGASQRGLAEEVLHVRSWLKDGWSSFQVAISLLLIFLIEEYYEHIVSLFLCSFCSVGSPGSLSTSPFLSYCGLLWPVIIGVEPLGSHDPPIFGIVHLEAWLRSLVEVRDVSGPPFLEDIEESYNAFSIHSPCL
ncbi:hypothetical protein CK203_062581 [Vitis vinifera]|uniref:Reverse transcriptase RNase H-like domain-containing protein n=1 Tax=Vitis vinifera TaxID=29760 RepID=A0A438FQE9_VITVI|nr:hypothetical protein CK203_062581 [Vitis vinifera]